MVGSVKAASTFDTQQLAAEKKRFSGIHQTSSRNANQQPFLFSQQ
jgi:hypothetical protein